MMRKIQVNVTFVDLLTKIPSYARFMKQLVSNKTKLARGGTIQLTETCSALFNSTLPPKMKDPGAFTIPCQLGKEKFEHTLCDLGASISLMPFPTFNRLGMGKLKETRMTLQLADRSLVTPSGFIEDVIVKVDNLYFPCDFVIVDIKEDARAPLIVGRPFLATADAHIEVAKGTISLNTDDDSLVFYA